MSGNLGEISAGKLKILKAVSEILEDPSAKITISRIARSVNVTEAAIYRHYRSKEDIFVALVGYMENNFLSPLNLVQQQVNDTEQRLERVFRMYMEFLAGHPGLARLFLGHGATEASSIAERIQLMHSKIRAQVAQMLRFGQAQGALQYGLEPEQGAEMFYGFVVAAAMAQAFNFPQIATDDRWEVLRRSMLNSKPAA